MYLFSSFFIYCFKGNNSYKSTPDSAKSIKSIQLKNDFGYYWISVKTLYIKYVLKAFLCFNSFFLTLWKKDILTIGWDQTLEEF